MSAVSHAESATSPARPKAARAPCEARHTSEKLPAVRRTSSQHGRLQHPAHAQALRDPQDAGARRRAGAHVVAAELERFTDFGGRERVRVRVPRAALGRHRDGKDALPRGLPNAADDEAEDLPAGGRHQATAEVRRCQAAEDAATAGDVSGCVESSTRRPLSSICAMAWRFHAIDATLSPSLVDFHTGAMGGARSSPGRGTCRPRPRRF